MRTYKPDEMAVHARQADSPTLVARRGERLHIHLCDVEPGDRDGVVAVLIEQTIRSGMPVVYVTCGGDDPARRELAVAAAAGDERFLVSADDDYWMMLPTGDLEDIEDDCGETEFVEFGVPTLLNAWWAVQRHESVHGPGLLILDDIARARPFAAGDPTFPSLARARMSLTAAEVAAWRDNELTRLAQARPHGFMLVVERDANLGDHDRHSRLT